MRSWLLLLPLVLAAASPGPAGAQCPCQQTDPYAKLTPEGHRAKFDALLGAASTGYRRTLAAIRAGDLKAAKQEAVPFLRAWEEVAGGFWSHPPKGLEKPDPWLKWLPVAHERLGEGVQLIVSADDLKGALRALEGGRWALARLREENGAPLLPDRVLRARQAQEELRQALASGSPERVQQAGKRLGELAAAISQYPDPPEAKAWGEKTAAAAASPTADALAASRESLERLRQRLGDRLN